MKHLILATAVLAASPAFADYEQVEAEGSVAEVMDRLQSAAEEAGATIFARVDHGAGAASVDMQLQDAQLLIFGNPKLGTPPMQQDIRAGLHLPLRMLVHAGPEGGTFIVWQEVDDMMDDTDVDDDFGPLKQMESVLERLAEEAAEG